VSDSPQLALLLDGGFVKKRLARHLAAFPSAADVRRFVDSIANHDALAPSRVFRVYWHDAEPFAEKRRNPIDGKQTHFGSTMEAVRNRELMNELEAQPDFAVRRGDLFSRGWRVASEAMKELAKQPPRNLKGADLEPVFVQKGVDMRIELDIASLALKRLVSGVVLVSGDSDMMPAMKLARREGLRVYLHAMGHPERRRELVVHADRVLG
jgi:uncharacterized LabA/DUF88 family protein